MREIRENIPYVGGVYMSKQQIGVVGMAVMGKNLALNIESAATLLHYSTVQEQKQQMW